MKQHFVQGISPEGFHQIAYKEWGNWSPQYASIICVHGLTRNGGDFDELAYYLSNKGRYLLCPDVVGRGNSDWFNNAAHYNLPQYVSDMNALIARTNSAQVDWIGTSMGGIIGMCIAALPHSPIRKLIINDIGAQIPLAGLRRLRKYAGKNPVFKNIEEAKCYCKIHYADFGNLNEEQWDSFTKRSIKLSSDGYVFTLDPGIRKMKSIGKWLNEFIHHPHKALEGIVYDINLWSMWKQIQCPVLIIHGKRSDLLTSETILKMQQIHPYTEVYEVEDAGHAPALLDIKSHETICNWLNK